MHRGGRQSYRREYVPSSQRDYQSDYIDNGKYDQNSRGEQDRERPVNPQALIESFEKQLESAAADMKQALNSLSTKDNEKFDLIFSILRELQTRQTQLDDSVRTVQAQLSAAYGGQQLPQGHTQPAQDPSQPQNSMNGNMVAEANGQVGGKVSANGQCMGQNGANMNFMPVQQMVAADGSQGYFTGMPIMMAPAGMHGMQQMPQNMQQMGQMTYAAMPQMMQPTQAVPMQYMSQDQAGVGFQQWSGPDASQQSLTEPNAVDETGVNGVPLEKQ